MKALYKLMTVLICFVMIVSCGGVLWAKEEYDAFHINDEEASEYKFKYDDTAVKMYSGIFCYDFAQGRDIYDIVKSSEDKTAYIVSSDNMIEIRYKTNGQTITAPISCLARSCLSQICVLAQTHGTYFDADVEVINTYIFHEMWGLSIYFVTNKGDFVMYKESIVSEVIYLIPEEIYRECAVGMVNFIRSTEGGSCPGYTYFAELSEYQIYPEKFPEITPEPTPEINPTPETEPVTEHGVDDEDDTMILPETTPQKTPEAAGTENVVDKDNSDAKVPVVPILIISAIPTVILAVIVIILLKRR